MSNCSGCPFYGRLTIAHGGVNETVVLGCNKPSEEKCPREEKTFSRAEESKKEKK